MPRTMPFAFILDYLPSTVVVQPAIGMFYIYWNRKIMLIARQTKKNPQHNGLWVASEEQYHTSLKQDIPAITDFIFDEGENITTQWLLLTEQHNDFEPAALDLCSLISQRDPRIGRTTPKSEALFR